MDINFEYYKIFYYAAKYRNMTKAAAALGSNQPNVTRIMKLLETQLGCRLFIREARGISLTEEGERLFSHVEIAYQHLLNAQKEISRQDSLGGGTVEIGATETAIHLFLLDALRDFKKEYPGVRIKIHNHATPETMRQLISGKLDFAVVTTPFEMPKTVSCEKVLDFEDILVGGMEYRHLCGKSLSLEDFIQYSWIGLGRGSATYELYRNFLIENKIDREPDMEVASSDLMLPLIEGNLGIGIVPKRQVLPLLEEKRLVRIPVSFRIPGRSIRIAADKGRGRGLAADTFYRYLKNR
ncbi:LysR family transcriptional regulator [Clostridiaceae bacterium]|nr:LysR family transcriptional regulator [Clostridiaceae bacterium]RKI10926.1 LysR family transcriptional regulator [bacterium 1XD21-70]